MINKFTCVRIGLMTPLLRAAGVRHLAEGDALSTAHAHGAAT